MKQTLKPTLGDIIKFISCILFFWCFLIVSTPRFETIRYRFYGGEQRESGWPLNVPTVGTGAILQTTIHLPRWYPTRYRITPDDCLQQLWINDKQVQSSLLPLCNLNGEYFSLSPYLHAGNNRLKVIMKDLGGDLKFNMEMTPLRDPLFFLATIPFFASLLYVGWKKMRTRHTKKILMKTLIDAGDEPCIRSLLIKTGIMMSCILFFWCFLIVSTPRFETISYRLRGHEQRESGWPLNVPTVGTGAILQTTIHLPRWYPTRYRITPDDCLQQLWINDKQVQSSLLPLCNLNGEYFNLSPYLHAGNNRLKVIMKDLGGDLKFNMEMTPLRDPLFFLATIPFFASLLYVGWKKMRTRHTKKILMKTLIDAGDERWLCTILVVGKLILFWRYFGEISGHDPFPYMDMVRTIRWDSLLLNVRSAFYAYHPPLAFLLCNMLYSLGLSDTQSIQVIGLLASFGAFFLLRATLQRLGLLYRPAALAFLYLAGMMPIQLFLQKSLNMDVVILFCATLVLYASIRLFWIPASSKTTQIGLWFALGVGLVSGVLTKFSGLLLPAIPILSVLLSPQRLLIRKIWKPLLCTFLLSAALTFPYYYLRYQRTEKTFVPINIDWFGSEDQEYARRARDADVPKFFKTLLFSNPITLNNFTVRDNDQLRLWNVWWDFWVSSFPPFDTRIISLMELYAATIGMLLGLLVLILKKEKDLRWRHFGYVLLALSAIFGLSQILYAYQHPHNLWWPLKGIYVAPMLYGIAFLLAEALVLYPLSLLTSTALGHRILVGGLCIFMLLNLMLPLYV